MQVTGSEAGSEQGNEADTAEQSAEEVELAVDTSMSLEEATSTILGSLEDIWTSFLAHLPFVVAAVLVLFVSWIIAAIVTHFVRKLMSRAKVSASLKDLVRQIAYIAIWVGGFMVAAMIVFPGMTPTKLLTVLGLSSIAIGFAFKDIVENFFAGILILWRFPFDPGDFIECGDLHGKVETTSIRMTLLRTVDGQLVVVPNAMLFKQPVNVLTDRSERRITIICGVAYDEDVDEARKIIEEAVKNCKTVSQSKDVEIFAREFADSSVNFEVTWWAGSRPVDIRRSRDEVIAAIKRALDDAGIEIPFPYRTLTFKESLNTRITNSDNVANGSQNTAEAGDPNSLDSNNQSAGESGA